MVCRRQDFGTSLRSRRCAEGKTQFVPKTWEKTFFDWLENIEPWCVSRQLWWGHQIPAWYAPWGEVYVEESADEAYAAALASRTERGALTEAEAEALARDPARLAETFQRDEDVLDTWFSSALWPFSTLGWPDETPSSSASTPPTRSSPASTSSSSGSRA